MKPKPEKKEYIVPLIKKNVWRLPPGSKRGTGKEEEQAGKSEEDKALEKEAAEAIMRGKEGNVSFGKVRGGGGERVPAPLNKTLESTRNVSVWPFPGAFIKPLSPFLSQI